MIKKRLLLLFIFLFPLSAAQSDIFTAENLVARIDISSGVEIIELGSGFRIDEVLINLFFFPINTWNQEVGGIRTEPRASVGDGVRYSWLSPEERKLDFSLSAVVETTNGFVEVKEKIPFPLRNLPDEFDIYIEPQENIDSASEDIIRTASDIVKGEDDLYEAVFKIANWVEGNIEYTLDTLTAEVSQKASWVLENRIGVCDELTSLFVAMVRSLGIPAKYISGVAYTNWKNLNDFGPHAWAEVYFPNVGWVPFDITYGEFGFIDTSHIKLKEGVDSNEASVTYKWEGWLTNLETEKLDIKTEIISIGKKLKPLLEIETTLLKENVGFNSHNLVEVLLKNVNDFYVPTEVFISRSQGLTLLDSPRKQVLLKPNEEKIVFWLLKIDDLDEDYIYTFKMAARTSRNASSVASFKSSKNEPVYNLEIVESIMEQKTEETGKIYSKLVSLDCDTGERVYIGEEVNITCTIKNLGNIYLEGITVCGNENCESLDLGISQEKSLSLSYDFFESGKKEMQIVARNRDVSKAETVNFQILDLPKIVISDIVFPLNLSYREKYSISFVMNKSSDSNPRNLEIELKQGFSKKWSVEELEQDRRFIINLNSLDLVAGENEFIILVKYKDDYNRDYFAREKFIVKLENLNVLEKSIVFLNKVTKVDLDFRLLILVAFVFGIVIGFIFRKGKKKNI